MQRASNRIYKMDNRIETATSVVEGEKFVVETLNAYGKSFANAEEMESFFQMNNEHEKRALGHPCTGPIMLSGASSQTSIQIHIHDIKILRAYQCVSQSSGVFSNRIYGKRYCQIFDIAKKDILSIPSKQICIQTTPSVGFIGTFSEDVISCGRCSENGGNIDLNFLQKGAKITLPVNTSSARIAVGDLHLIQGNGEASGTGIEADGEIILSMNTVAKISYPVIEHQDLLCIVGWGPTIDESLKQGVKNCIDYFRRFPHFQSWAFEDLYQLVSVLGNMILGNATGKTKTCGIVLKKSSLMDTKGIPIL
jgi:acetamidase/formamidase